MRVGIEHQIAADGTGWVKGARAQHQHRRQADGQRRGPGLRPHEARETISAHGGNEMSADQAARRGRRRVGLGRQQDRGTGEGHGKGRQACAEGEQEGHQHIGRCQAAGTQDMAHISSPNRTRIRDAGRYFTELAMLLNLFFTLFPTVPTAPITTTAIRAAIKPYSMAVAPRSSSMNCETKPRTPPGCCITSSHSRSGARRKNRPAPRTHRGGLWTTAR